MQINDILQRVAAFQLHLRDRDKRKRAGNVEDPEIWEQDDSNVNDMIWSSEYGGSGATKGNTRAGKWGNNRLVALSRTGPAGTATRPHPRQMHMKPLY